MTDELDRLLEQAAGEVSAFPSNFSELKSLIASLPSPLAPDIRSAATGQVNTTEPATAAQQVASALTGAPPGSESGATIGVVSELFYANANFFDNPTFSACSDAVGLSAVDVEFATDWEAKYDLNSGVAPTSVAMGLNDTRFAPNGFHPFNSHAVDINYNNGAGASDVTVTVSPRDTLQIFFETELPYIVAAIKVTTFGRTIDANTTKFNARLELWDANGAGTLLAQGTSIDFLTKSGDNSTYRLAVAFALPSAIAGLYAFKPRLIVNFAKSSGGGNEGLTIGEPVFALASTQAPPPFSPIIARWLPSYLQVRNAGDLQNRMEVGVLSEREATSVRIPQVSFGAGGLSTKDVRIWRSAAGVLRLENPNGPARAALELVAGTTPGAAPAGTGRLWFDSATKHLWQIDDAGVLTDLAAGGGGPATQVSHAAAVAGAGDYVARMKLAADTEYRIQLGLNTSDTPELLFGGGALTAPDTRLYRAIADRLKTDDEFEIGRAGATDNALIHRVGAEATARFVALTDGQMQWGPGGAGARDTNLYRDAANLLRTDDQLQADSVTVERAGGVAYRARNAGDADSRFRVQATGSVEWGDGTAAPDVTLSRDAADSIALNASDILNLAAAKLTLPVNTTAETTQGRMRLTTPSDATTGAQVRVYDSQRERLVGSAGWQPYSYALGGGNGQAYATALALAGSGGSAAIPMPIDGHMLLQSITIRATAASGALEFRIYVQRLNNGSGGENTLNEVPSSAGTTAASGGAANVTGNVTAAPLYLGPGLYWLVVRTTSATAFSLGTLAAGTLGGSSFQTKTIGALAATLDFVAATWTKQTAVPGVRFNGRVFGQTAAF